VKLIIDILISTLAGLLSAVLGWFSAYVAGVLLQGSDQSLGAGLPTVALMYVAALAFGIFGFFVCLVWRLRKAKSK